MSNTTDRAAVDPQQERGGDAAAILAFLNGRPHGDGDGESSDILLTVPRPDGLRGWLHLTESGLRAVLAELEQLRAERAELGDEWSYETKNSWSGWRRCTTSMTEEYARKRAGDSERNRLVHRKASDWRVVDTIPQQPEPTGGPR